MKHRLFVAINLPSEIKNKIGALTQDIDLKTTGRRAPPGNWHLTLSFLGYQPAEAIPLIVDAIKETAKNFAAPEISLEKIISGPQGGRPRMIWLVGSDKTSESLGKIKNELDDKLTEKGIGFERETRKYHSHITLARFESTLRTSDVQNIDNKLRDIGRQEINFIPRSLDLMESVLKRTGAEYDLLSGADFC